MYDRSQALQSRRLLRGAALLLAAALAACSPDPTQPDVQRPPPAETVPVASLELDAASLTLDEGASRRLTATPRAADGSALAGRAVAWASSDTRVATIQGDGSVGAVGIGTATITATSEGKSASATIVVAGTYGYDLLFDARTGATFNYPELYRLDIRTAGALATRLPSVGNGATHVVASPDGSRIAFVAAMDGQLDLYVANRDGSELRRLTHSKDFDDQPSWSPDGTRIAFRRWNYIGVPHDVWVIDADGSRERNLTADLDGEQRSPSWSPVLADGTARLVFAQVTRGASGYLRGRLYTMRDDGTDKRAITAEAERLDDEPAWSPDGRSILFVRTGGEFMGDLWLVDPSASSGQAGGEERRLMANDPPLEQASPAWSPDGALVAFTSRHEIIGNRSGDWQVYTVRADGTDLRRRTSDPVDHANPAWVRR